MAGRPALRCRMTPCALACDSRADIGLVLMVRSDNIDRLAEHFATGIFDRHTCCSDVAGAAEIGTWSRQIAEHANAHGVIRHLSAGRPAIGGCQKAQKKRKKGLHRFTLSRSV